MAILPKPTPGKEPESQLNTYVPPGLNGYNREPFLGLRRIMQLDGANRIASQIEHDRGAYSRAPVAPVEYGEGNIKKSTAFTGPAGYNHQAIPIADSPDDMSQTDYMISLRQATGPERFRMRQALSIPQQNFLYTQMVRSDDYPLNSHNMMNNLLSLASTKLAGGGR